MSGQVGAPNGGVESPGRGGISRGWGLRRPPRRGFSRVNALGPHHAYPSRRLVHDAASFRGSRRVSRGSLLVCSGLVGLACATPSGVLAGAPAHATPRGVGSAPTLIPDSEHREVGQAYARARSALAQGQPKRALGILGKLSGDFLVDRRHILRGRALARLGQYRLASEAYLQGSGLAENATVHRRAQRGLIDSLGRAGAFQEQLTHLEGIRAGSDLLRDTRIRLKQAEALYAVDRPGEAIDLALKVAGDSPYSSIRKRALRLAGVWAQGKWGHRSFRIRLRLAESEHLFRSGARRRAFRLLSRVKKMSPIARIKAATKRADFYRRSRKRRKERRVLKKLVASGAQVGPSVLFRLGELEVRAGASSLDAGGFAKVLDRFPHSRDAMAVRYRQAHTHYDDERFEDAYEAFARVADVWHDPATKEDALWWAGWSAYRAHRLQESDAAFSRLLHGFPSSSLAFGARYWRARLSEKAGRSSQAQQGFESLWHDAPLDYYGLLAASRLKSMGVGVFVLPTPPLPSHLAMDTVVQGLGRDRPHGVDRALALFHAGMVRAAREELDAAVGIYEKSLDVRGAVGIVELLQLFGQPKWAARLARRILSWKIGSELHHKPYAWRVWRYAYPKPFGLEVSKAATGHSVDPLLIYAVMRTESLFRPDAVSPVGAQGLMQVMPATAAWIARQIEGGRTHWRNRRTPSSNLWLGAWYLGSLLSQYSGQMVYAFGAYNAGPTAMNRWRLRLDGLDLDEFVEAVPYRETRRYLRSTTRNYFVYQTLAHGVLPNFVNAFTRMKLSMAKSQFELP